MTAGVSFVVGSFVLADSLRAAFDNLFSELSQDVDLEVRAAQAFDGDNAREPIDVTIADELRTVRRASRSSSRRSPGTHN